MDVVLVVQSDDWATSCRERVYVIRDWLSFFFLRTRVVMVATALLSARIGPQILPLVPAVESNRDV